MSANKVRVTTLLGSTGVVGWINPKLTMETDKGPILALGDGNHQVTVGVGTGDTPQQFYPWQLRITQAHATGDHAWPTGDGGYKFGRSTLWPNGVPEASQQSGVYIYQGNEVQEFGI